MAKRKRSGTIRIGCAGWSIGKEYADEFPGEGTHLTRYAGRFPAAEINSSFHKPHRPTTYEKWARSVPADFWFAVKVPKEATHKLRLADTEDVLDRFLAEAAGLGDKLGPLLVQLPPSLKFEAKVAASFFKSLRERTQGDVACEPRHPTWFEGEPERLFRKHRVARVAADPALAEDASKPGGWEGLAYYRLHGSPRVYYSAYDSEYLETLSVKLAKAAKSADVWCIFDNTASGAATANALELLGRVRS
jgi:uncharacterized protein YecE (DUF72 family)